MLDEQTDLSPCFVTKKPTGLLSRYVEMIWFWRGGVPAHQYDRMMPSGTAGLVINLAEDAIRLYSLDGERLEQTIEGASFSGACIAPFVIDTAEQVHVAGVSFQPGGAFPFMPAAQDELLGSHVSLRDIWGLDVASLREQLLIQRSPAHALATLERALVARIARPLDQHLLVAKMLARIERDPLAVRIKDICADLPLSTRRLSRLFELEVGMTPKVYARLCRFRALRAAIHARHDSLRIDWAEMALDCGYYDQSHLVHEFKAFSGFTPSEYRLAAPDLTNHVPMR